MNLANKPPSLPYAVQAGAPPPSVAPIGTPANISAPPAMGSYPSVQPAAPLYGPATLQRPPVDTPFGVIPPYGRPPANNPQYVAPPPQPVYPPQQGFPLQQFPQQGYTIPPNYGVNPYQPSSQQTSGFPYQQAGPSPVNGVISLVKGGNMSLSKAAPNLRQVTLGIGWDVRQTPGVSFDLDASVFILKGDGRVRMPQDLVFYNNLRSVDSSIWHHGDNLTGVGEGDDEQVSVDLTRVPLDIQKIVLVVSIYEAETRGQNFGMVSRAFIRVFNSENNQEIVRYDLTEEAKLYRYSNEWKFRAIGQGIVGGLRACGQMFGIAMQ